ncbi:hypothetical protein [Rhodococcus jostii]|uniref:hypothetical protein n=1 Tax=Rhodococcus jostii TaxID=132919 RepID=UPI00363CF8BC
MQQEIAVDRAIAYGHDVIVTGVGLGATVYAQVDVAMIHPALTAGRRAPLLLACVYSGPGA